MTSPAGSPRNKPLILIVDDDEDLLLVMEMKMKAEGYRVLISFNANNIHTLLSNHRPDMILMDITMNGVSGKDVCSDLKSKEQTKHIPLLMFSANHNIVQIAKECGADDFLTKPFDVNQLKLKIKTILGNSES